MSSFSKIGRFEAPSALLGALDAGARNFLSGRLKQLALLKPGIVIGQKITGLALPVSDLRKGSGEKAQAIYRGVFSFAGEKFHRSEDNLFCENAMGENWLEELHGFAWLADLAASRKELSRVQARAIISEWLEACGRFRGLNSYGRVQPTHTVARRVISLSVNARFVLENASDVFAQKFYQRMGAQVKFLQRRCLSEQNGQEKLLAAIAICYASISFKGLEALREKAFEQVSRLLDHQVFADGGHISRNPQVLRDLLADLLPLRCALEDARLEVLPAFNNVIERMLPALRFFTYLDGGLAVFNGVNDTRPGLVKRILDIDSVRGTPLTHAVHSGYLRLQRSTSTIMIDVGKPAMPHINTASAAGLMAFEFCDGSARLVTNCGSIRYGDLKWNEASRQTQAHSDVCLNDTPVGQMLDGAFWRRLFGGTLVFSAANISVEHFDNQQGVVFVGRHDGYAKRHGIAHERQLFLSADGNDFRGQDKFECDEKHAKAGETVPFAIRFHLHPSVRATISQDGASAMLLLANKSGWRFSARGGQLKLAESVYLPEDGRMRKTMQLVLSGQTSASKKVLWAFKRIEKRKPATTGPKAKSVNQAPELF